MTEEDIERIPNIPNEYFLCMNEFNYARNLCTIFFGVLLQTMDLLELRLKRCVILRGCLRTLSYPAIKEDITWNKSGQSAEGIDS